MIVVTNTNLYGAVERIDVKNVDVGAPIIALTQQTVKAPIAANI